MIDKTYNLRTLWNAIIEVYKVVAHLCDSHGLRYYAYAGTALGAVRHKGFIPWDDDFDLMMPRPDYERFVRIAKSELPNGYVWLDRRNCPQFKYGFGKVMVSDKEIVDRVAEESNLPLGHGIFVDIFPLDGYPDNWSERKVRKLQNWLISFRAVYIDGWRSCHTRRAKMAWIVGALISMGSCKYCKFRDHQEKVDLCETRAIKCMFGTTRQCVSIGLSKYSDDKPFDLALLGEPMMVPFENTSLPVPEYVDLYLKSRYGDYMRLPPLENRILPHMSSTHMPWRLGPMK